MRVPARNHQRQRRFLHRALSAVILRSSAREPRFGCFRHLFCRSSSSTAWMCPSRWFTAISGSPRANASALAYVMPDQQRARQPRTRSHRNRIRSSNVTRASPAPRAPPARWRADARGWPVPAPRRHIGMRRNLRSHHGRQRARAALHHRRGRLIAGAFNAENEAASHPFSLAARCALRDPRTPPARRVTIDEDVLEHAPIRSRAAHRGDPALQRLRGLSRRRMRARPAAGPRAGGLRRGHVRDSGRRARDVSPHVCRGRALRRGAGGVRNRRRMRGGRGRRALRHRGRDVPFRRRVLRWPPSR